MRRKKEGYNARLDESLGMRHHGRHRQDLVARRRESEGEERAMKGHAYEGVRSMDDRARMMHHHHMSEAHHRFMADHHRRKRGK